jgi:hypothetical protein
MDADRCRQACGMYGQRREDLPSKHNFEPKKLQVVRFLRVVRAHKLARFPVALAILAR